MASRFNLDLLSASLLIVCLGVGVNVHATTYGASFEDSKWQAASSELECRLAQPIPQFGEGVFSKKAGYGLSFWLQTYENPFAAGKARLVVEAPEWKPGIVSRPIGTIDVNQERVPVYLDQPQANIVLASLNTGLMPTIAGSKLHALDTSDWIKVAVSSANFQPAYQEYTRCLTDLLPVSFEQIARSALFFDTNNASINDDVKRQLDLIARYVKADKSISRIFIDGHTDDLGTLPINKSLSKRRASVIANYLKSSGISKNKIVSRYHADKYPALKNDSDANRARNRRVTIRLEK